jgi:hypothetical protein
MRLFPKVKRGSNARESSAGAPNQLAAMTPIIGIAAFAHRRASGSREERLSRRERSAHRHNETIAVKNQPRIGTHDARPQGRGMDRHALEAAKQSGALIFKAPR